MNRLAPGSFLAISHLVSANPRTAGPADQPDAERYRRQLGAGAHQARGRQVLRRAGRHPADLVEITTWRPDDTAAEEQTYDWIEYGGTRKQP